MERTDLDDNDRAIATFTMVAHALVHWFELAIPIFLVIWVGEFDVSVGLLGVIVALGYAPFGIGALPSGLLADRYGAKHLVVICLAGMSVSFVVLAVATSVYTIALSLIFWGVTASIYHPAGLALISTGVEQRGTVFAWHGIAGNVGIALGPFATATLLLVLEWRLVSALLAVPGIVSCVYGLRAQFDSTAALNDGDTESNESITVSEFVSNSRTLFTRSFLFVFAIVTIVGLFYRGSLTYLPEILHGLPAMDDVGTPGALEEFSLAEYLYVGLLVAGMGGQYVGGKLTVHVAVGRGLLTIFAALVILTLAFVPVTSIGLVPIVLLCGFFGFTLFAIEPFYQEAVAVYTPADTRGLAYGYTYLGMFGLGSMSISIGGFVLERFPLGVFFASLSMIALLGVVIATRFQRSRHSESAASTNVIGIDGD